MYRYIGTVILVGEMKAEPVTAQKQRELGDFDVIPAGFESDTAAQPDTTSDDENSGI